MSQGVDMIKSPAYSTAEEDDVQINCIECGSKAVIGSRAEKDPKVIDLYCSCKNPICGHTFVSTLSFSHTLSPSANQSKALMLEMFQQMPKAEQLELLNQARVA
jgi:Ogr/Delta-like zinc finger